MVIYKYYINEKYNASALTPGCCPPLHPDVFIANYKSYQHKEIIGIQSKSTSFIPS
jgi:hypothetical protein